MAARYRIYSQVDLIRLKPLAEKLGVNPFTLRRWYKEGKFPAPIRLGQQTLAFKLAEVEDWLSEREERADG